MLATLFNFAGGAGIKLITSGLSKYWDFKRHKELSILNQTKDNILAFQSGTDKADLLTRITRSIIALLFVGSWVFIMNYIILHPDIEFTVFVGRSHSWIWSLISPFPVNDKGIAVISAGQIIFGTKPLIEMLFGFFFTKIGK